MTDVAVIGAGIAGLEAARQLAMKGFNVIVFEKTAEAGGHAAQWHELFPFKQNGKQILHELALEAQKSGVQLRLNTPIEDVSRKDNQWEIHTGANEKIKSRGVLIASGFALFDARQKEELGYGIYPQVITSEDLEKCWSQNRLPFEAPPKPQFAIVHCVGSRDLKCHQAHCSKVCCMVGVKAAIELKKRYPSATVTNFYMDLRMFDHGYEELYHEAQLSHGVQFLRGRVSEIAPAGNGKVKVKAEDTLLGMPVSCLADGVILLTGMTPDETLGHLPLPRNSMKFWSVPDKLLAANTTDCEGIFVAGSCKGPMTLTESVSDARSAAINIENYLK